MVTEDDMTSWNSSDPSEVSWEFYAPDGTIVASGGAGSTATVGSCGATLGCTDESAANYNPLATEDDGSCIGLCEACADAGGFYCGDDESNWTSYSPNGCVPDYYMADGYDDCVDGGDEVAGAVTDCGGDEPTTCADDTACNYGAEGDCEYESCACEGTEVTVDGGSYQSEVSWTISDCDGNELASGGAPYSECLDLPDNYVINM